MRILGIDPGTKNFAVVFLDEHGRVEMARMLRSTIRSNALEAAPQRPQYRHVMRTMLRRLRPRAVMAEAFIQRGFGTKLTELVNLMLGSMQCECDHLGIDEHSTQATTWKNDANRHGSLDALYALAKTLRVPPHMVDAMMLATYLRHNRSFATVRWRTLETNVRRISRVAPRSHLEKPGRSAGAKRRKKCPRARSPRRSTSRARASTGRAG